MHWPIACSTLAFSRLTLPDALTRIAAMGFRYVDIAAHEGWAHLQPSELVTAPDTWACVYAIFSPLRACKRWRSMRA